MDIGQTPECMAMLFTCGPVFLIVSFSPWHLFQRCKCHLMQGVSVKLITGFTEVGELAQKACTYNYRDDLEQKL